MYRPKIDMNSIQTDQVIKVDNPVDTLMYPVAAVGAITKNLVTGLINTDWKQSIENLKTAAKKAGKDIIDNYNRGLETNDNSLTRAIKSVTAFAQGDIAGGFGALVNFEGISKIWTEAYGPGGTVESTWNEFMEEVTTGWDYRDMDWSMMDAVAEYQGQDPAGSLPPFQVYKNIGELLQSIKESKGTDDREPFDDETFPDDNSVFVDFLFTMVSVSALHERLQSDDNFRHQYEGINPENWEKSELSPKALNDGFKAARLRLLQMEKANMINEQEEKQGGGSFVLDQLSDNENTPAGSAGDTFKISKAYITQTLNLARMNYDIVKREQIRIEKATQEAIQLKKSEQMQTRRNKSISMLMNSGADFMGNKFDVALVVMMDSDHTMRDIFDVFDNDSQNFGKYADDKVFGDTVSFMTRITSIDVPQMESETFEWKFLFDSVKKIKSKVKFDRKSSIKMRIDEPLFYTAFFSLLSNNNMITPKMGIYPKMYAPFTTNRLVDENITTKKISIDLLVAHRCFMRSTLSTLGNDTVPSIFNDSLNSANDIITGNHNISFMKSRDPSTLPYWRFEDVNFLGNASSLSFSRDSADIQEIEFPFLFKRLIRVDMQKRNGSNKETVKFGPDTITSSFEDRHPMKVVNNQFYWYDMAMKKKDTLAFLPTLNR